MIRTISADQAHATFSDLLESVHGRNDEIIVEEDGEPVAVLISPETFQRFQHLQRQTEEAWVTLDEFRARNGGRDPDEVLDDVTTVVEQIRQAREHRRKSHSCEPPLIRRGPWPTTG